MKKIILLLFTGLLLIEIISALTVTLNVPLSFSAGDLIHFNYSITSDINQEVVFFPYTFCPHSIARPLEQINTNLISDVPYNQVYFDTTVDANFEPQICTASIYIVSPIQQTFSKNFTINTNPSFNFEIVLDKKIFIAGEEISVQYSSEVESPSIEANLIFPDDSIKQISLPYSFQADKIGTYNLNITASKEGYNAVSLTEQFGVIEENANIEHTAIQGNKSLSSLFGNNLIYFLIGSCVFLILVIIIVTFVIIKKRRKRKKNNL